MPHQMPLPLGGWFCRFVTGAQSYPFNNGTVRTSMSTAEDVPMNLVFQTHLVLEDERWKVDLEATREEVSRATVAAGMQMMSEIIGEGIHELGEALQRGAEQVEEAIREALQGPHGERI